MSVQQISVTVLVISCTLNVVLCRSILLDRQGFASARAGKMFKPFNTQADDLQAAATGHHYGRVQIKVYRGPDTHGKDHHEHFAPHGFWVKQPADADHHH